MGAIIPEKLRESDLSRLLAQEGLDRIFQGKVRDTYEIPSYPNLLLQIATDRISIFDFVLPALVKDKGKRLTTMTIFWISEVLQGINNHLVASGNGIDAFLPPNLQNNRELWERALVVKKVNILPVECIIRGYLTGSGWESYRGSRQVCGIKLPNGLHDGSKLQEPIFTPTTKAELGHDKDMSREEVILTYTKWIEDFPLLIYKKAFEYASSRGIIIADTKFEVGYDILADEVLTPDSSRFWLKEEWEVAARQKKSPIGYDKQSVREWGKMVKTPFGFIGIGNLNPENQEHIDFVHQLEVPEAILEIASLRYHQISQLLIG